MNAKPVIPDDYHCPFCPDHKDDDFVWSERVGTFICLGCRCEIDQCLDHDHQPTREEISCADTIDKLLRHLGVGYGVLRQRWRRQRHQQ